MSTITLCFLARYDLCSSCFGRCVREVRYVLDMIVYVEQQKLCLRAHQKTMKKFEKCSQDTQTAVESACILARFQHLKGKRAELVYFQDDSNVDRKILKEMQIIG